ncbi:MAG: 16S rRNA (adenine(1518)-N(6)/adenine(1519)-N(6))-dimethyltransferase [Rhodospirillaceae bacterium]|nr:16S rRNA (adenine(1518)-N(6)/adenine(1519)-N(6))-dimethyltransferase [Rhodospirillaceae bacterium]
MDDPPGAGPVNEPLRAVIARHGLWAKKGLGQNFLLDLNLTRRIARAAAPFDNVTVFEVGPGPGGLTRALLEAGATVVAVERDPRCCAALAELAVQWPGKLTLVEGDAREVDPADHIEGAIKIVANLPYNVATPLLVGWLGHARRFASMTLMFQKEVAQRIAAAPGSGEYGRLSVLAQWACETDCLFDIPPRAFVPPPKITSTVVRLVPRAEPEAVDQQALERVTAAAFGQRRKMLRASLRSLGIDTDALIADAGIEPTARAETLTIPQYCRLARAYAARSVTPPADATRTR